MIQTGTELDKLRSITTGELCGGFPKGALLVLAGEPDADACLELTLEALRGSGKSAVIVDATATNGQVQLDGSYLVHVPSFKRVPALLRGLQRSDFEVLVLHSLDAWDDWDEPGVILELVQQAQVNEITLVLHTKMLSDTLYFGDRMLRSWSGVVLRVDEQMRCTWLSGYDFIL